MNIKRSFYVFLSVLVVVGLGSCGSKSDDNKDSKEFKEAEGSLQEQIEDVIYNIPSPTEIPYLLQATGAEYNESLVNPRTKVDQYASRDRKSTRLNSSHSQISYAVFCLKKKKHRNNSLSSNIMTRSYPRPAGCGVPTVIL